MTSTNGKPKVALYWCSSCGGCEEAVVDLHEKILDVVAAVDIVFWPVAMDFKTKDVVAMEDGSILASFINGAIRTTEQEEMAHLLRKKSKVVVAFGACSHTGGIPGLGNLWDRDTILKSVYDEAPGTHNPDKVYPAMKLVEEGRTTTLPGFYNTVRTLDQVIDVDYYVPGCAPTANIIGAAVGALLSGNLPPKGTVLAPDVALCESCPRKDSKPEKLTIKEFKRPHEMLADPEMCLLAQGLLCMGPATRGGCEALCINGNMPCSGCFGPTSRVRDYGGKILSSIAANIDSRDEGEINKILDKIPDPIGTFYRYSLASSLLMRKKMDAVEKK
jgi:F420-non-reducing hydrogenase small subunit